MTNGQVHPNTFADRLIDGVIRAIQDRKKPSGIIQKTFRVIRFFLSFITVACLLVIGVLLLLLERRGETNVFLWFCLYLPPLIWILPLLTLFPLCLIFRPSYSLLILAGITGVVIGYMDFEWSRQPAAAGKPELKVLTNNIGQKNGRSITAFIKLENPDLIAFQDGEKAGSGYVQYYPDRMVKYHGEFILISRYPIVNSGLVEDVQWRGHHPIAAWFEVKLPNTTLLVYNVHLPTPRSELTTLGLRSLLKELLRPMGLLVSGGVDPLQARLHERRELVQNLIRKLNNEQRPMIVVGDFNFPNHGVLYHLMARALTDSFEKRGRGFGYTFPGDTRNPISLFNPWLRIDYIFTGRGVEPLSCRIEPRRRSQHRAVVATMVLKP